MIDAALRLRRIAAALREGRPIDMADAMPLADAIDAYFEGCDLLAALGLVAQGRGGVSARRAFLLAERDKAMIELAAVLGGEIGGENSEGIWNIHDALHGVIEADTAADRAEIERLAEVVRSLSSGGALSRRQIARLLTTFNTD